MWVVSRTTVVQGGLVGTARAMVMAVCNRELGLLRDQRQPRRAGECRCEAFVHLPKPVAGIILERFEVRSYSCAPMSEVLRRYAQQSGYAPEKRGWAGRRLANAGSSAPRTQALELRHQRVDAAHVQRRQFGRRLHVHLQRVDLDGRQPLLEQCGAPLPFHPR